MVLVFAVRDLKYPRNSILRAELAKLTDEPVKSVPIEWGRPKIARLVQLLRRGLADSKNSSVIFVAEFGLQYAILGWIIAKLRRATLVVDHFVGTYETHVLDFGSARSRSPRGWYFAMVDRIAFRLADVVTIDTVVRGEALSMRYGAKRKSPQIAVLPVGAPDWAKSLADEERKIPNNVLQVLFYGNYIPLHGVDFIVRSLAHVPLKSPFLLTLIGSAPQRADIEALAKKLGVQDRMLFLDAVSESELAHHLQQSDVVLGIFGDTSKARTVIANKVWQGLYAGKTVITRTSDALDELRPIVEGQLLGIDISDERSLALQLAPYFESPSRAIYRPRTVELDAYVNGSYCRLFESLGIGRNDRAR
jgi:glycosyltransferase involved in cell wall biosynthesis